MNRELADPDNEDAPSHARDPNRTSASMPSAQLHANPLAVAVAAGLTFSGVAFYADQATRDVLVIDAIPAAQAPRLDGDLSDPVWTSARPVVIRTNLAANFGGAASSRIEVRAVHDGTNAYFAFVWDDPTRSLKHLPLLKKADGWHVLQQGYDVGDETRIFEDGLAVLLSRTSDAALARNLDLGSPRAVGASPPGRGPQDAADGRLIDVWRWQASRGGLLGFIDDGHAIAGATGFTSDPGKTFFSHNFKEQAPGGYARPVQPLRLPKDPGALMSAMGRIDLDAEHGEPESARWWLTADESVPYTPALDNKIGVGTVIPGVVIAGEYAGDRAHVRCAAHWAAGRWTLEVARRLNTGSPYDVTLSSGVYMWVAAFDHSQSRPARHLRPVRLELK
jgi:hypothetical protein